ncbi:Uncharacterised protein g8605 [Pycnogonum litorale]
MSNEILDRIGGFGKFQLLLCVYAIFFSFLSCLPHISQILLTITPDHWCNVPELANLPDDQQKMLSVPIQEVSELDEKLIYSQCIVYKFNYTGFDEENSTHWKVSHSPNRTTGCTDGWNFDSSLQFSSLVTDLEWVCENRWKDVMLQSSFWFGAAVGSITFGITADLCGRRPAIMLVHNFGAISGIITAFMMDTLSACAARFMAGISFCVMCSLPCILVIEFVEPSKRNAVSFLITFMFSLSWVVFPMVAYEIGDWRKFMLFTSPLHFIIGATTWFMPESIMWLMMKKRAAHAIRTVKQIAVINSMYLSDDFLDKFKEEIVTRERVKYTMRDLFRTKGMQKLMILSSIIWSLALFGYTGAIYTTATLSYSPFTSVTLGSAFELFAPIIQVLLVDRIGRRGTCCLASLLSSISFILATVFIERQQLFLGFAIIGRVMATTVFNTAGLFCAELLPTELRARGVTFRQVIGTIGTILTSFVIYLRVYDKKIPTIIILMVMSIACVVVLFLPETMGSQLPVYLNDVDVMFDNHKVCRIKFCKKRRKDEKLDMETKENMI